MPVSPVPCILPALLLLAPIIALRRGRRAALTTLAVSAGIVLAILLWVYVPGWYLGVLAHRGDPVAQFDYARWRETHCEQINTLILWPCTPDVRGGYEWLEAAAKQDYPPAVYAIGVRLKHGWHVPPWSGPGGNHHPQPFIGQEHIDRSLALGYRPPVPEERWWAWWWRIRSTW